MLGPVRTVLIWLGALVAITSPGHAQFPSKQVRMVLPLPAGSATDNVARVIAMPLNQAFGQPVVVDNKPGADGAISATEVQRAAPDGHTLLFATNSPLGAVPSMRKTPPYDPIADFTPIGFVGRYLHVVLVHPDVPAKTLNEFFRYARANPGKLNYGSGGTFQIISTAQLIKIGGIDITHVPYKGEPAALVDLIAGRLQFMVATQSTSQQLVKEGKLRALAVTNSKRTDAFPNVPTFIESGINHFPNLSWAVLVGPAKMPASVVERINKDLNVALGREQVREQLARHAFEPIASTPEELRVFIKDQQELWARAVRELGLPTY
ncbi:MAG: Bug family tripartite tricarboxylate transporter substrate binding protein [Burkholderiales bacterium]